MKTKNLIKPIKTGLATKAEKKKKLEDACIVLDEVTKVKVAPSQVHGVGLFAMRDIKKGEKLYTDALPQMFDVPYTMFKKLRPDVREHILGRWPNIINGSHFLSDGMLATYLNHSDTPNYDAKKDETLKAIKQGEEVFEDYKKIENWEKLFPWIIALQEKR